MGRPGSTGTVRAPRRAASTTQQYLTEEESRTVVAIEMASNVVLPPINETESIHEMGDIDVICIHDGPGDYVLLRNVRYCT